MTIQDRLSEAERQIEQLQARASSLEQGQTAHDALMDRMTNVLERLAVVYVDISARLDRIESTLQAHSVDLATIRAVLEPGDD